MLTSLVPGVKYYVTVRAVTGAGGILESTSDGVTPDITKPSALFEDIQGVMTSQLSGPVYVRHMDHFIASWTTVEDESRVVATRVCLGSFPGSDNLGECLDTSHITAIPNDMISSEFHDGVPIFPKLEAHNTVSAFVNVIILLSN